MSEFSYEDYYNRIENCSSDSINYTTEIKKMSSESNNYLPICPICMESSLDLFIDSCQHPLCTECLETFFKYNKTNENDYQNSTCAKCPQCKFILIKERMQKMRFIKEIINYRLTTCEFKDNGCTFQGKLIDYMTIHRKLCEFKISKCPFMICKFSGNPLEVNEHQKTCKFQIVECLKCNECMIFKEYQQYHLDHKNKI